MCNIAKKKARSLIAASASRESWKIMIEEAASGLWPEAVKTSI